MVIRKEKDPNHCLHHLGRYFVEYSGVARIHGIRFLTRRTAFERLLWGILLLSFVLLCLGQIVTLLGRLLSTPVLDSYNVTEMYVYEVPFPAITICPETKSIKEVFNFEEVAAKLNNKTDLSERELSWLYAEFQNKSLKSFRKKLYEYLFDMCDYDMEGFIVNSSDFFAEDFYQTIDNVTDKVENIIEYCEWQRNRINCSKFFTRVFIDEGICYSFNIVDRNHLFSNKNYVPEHFFNSFIKKNDLTYNNRYNVPGNVMNYPLHSPVYGAERGFAVDLKINVSDYDFTCKSHVQGFRVLIHRPTDIPRGRQSYLRLSSSQSSSVSVIPRLIDHSQRIHFFSPKVRQCYMENEKYLKYFKQYSEDNCALECLSNYTLFRCECVAFYMPRSRDIPICGFNRLGCTHAAEDEMDRKQLNGENVDLNFCVCMKSCTKLDYHLELSASFIPDYGESFSSDDMEKKAHLRVYFQENSFMIRQSKEVFTVTSLIASIGGLVGLFVGASVITIIEFIYYWTWRLLYNKRLYNRWSGSRMANL